MAVIKKLGDRVQREHDQFLRDSQRIEDRSAIPVNGATTPSLGGGVNFENLVGRGDGLTVKPDTVLDSAKSWDEDDVWGSIFSSEVGALFFILAFTHRLPLTEPAIASYISSIFSTDDITAGFTNGSHCAELFEK